MGEITKEDYPTLGPAVAAPIKQYGAIRLLVDLSDFKKENAEAWASDLGFGKEYHDQIERSRGDCVPAGSSELLRRITNYP